MSLVGRARKLLDGSPAWVSNLYWTARGARMRLVEFGPAFVECLCWLRESEWWDAGRIREFQDARLRETVAHAYAKTPFYREWFDASGVRPADIQSQDDLPRLPLLTKQHVREHQRRMVDPAHADRWGARTRLTSGTTGVSVTVPATRGAMVLMRAAGERFRERFGLTVRARQLRFAVQLGLLGRRDRPPYWFHNYAGRRTAVSPLSLSEQAIPALADYICREPFDHYTGWPSPMVVIANYIREHGLTVRHAPKVIDYSSETLHASARRRLEEVYRTRVAGRYGLNELCAGMSECEHGRYHIDPEMCCVETEPAPSAGPGVVKLIVTGLGNPAMPFVRYETGDMAAVTPPEAGPCPCGRATRTFDAIYGRQEDHVRTPDGRLAYGLVVRLPGAREVQLYQPRVEELEVRVVPAPDYSDAEERAMLARLRQRLGDEIAIRVVKMDAIPRTPSGKFRGVISDA